MGQAGTGWWDCPDSWQLIPNLRHLILSLSKDARSKRQRFDRLAMSGLGKTLQSSWVMGTERLTPPTLTANIACIPENQ